MAGKGRQVVFHGAFKSKADARRKERRLGKGAYIESRRVKGQGVRHIVITRRRP